MPKFRCVQCSGIVESDDFDVSCGKCGGAVLLSDQKLPYLLRDELDRLPPGVWRYRALLPEIQTEDIVTLGEGATPLLRAERLGRSLGLSNLYLKDESRNPTGSFIDRGSTVLVSLAKSRGVAECSCVTTGNLGASLAAYCAKAGIRSHIRIHPTTDRGKLYQMVAYGARVDAASGPSRTQAPEGSRLAVTAANPYVLEGEKTTCFEIVQDLDWKSPDVIVVPVGTGGHLSMTWRAISQLRASGLLDKRRLRLVGVQLEGSGSGTAFTELEESEPFFVREAARALEESGGHRIVTTPSESVRATGLLAQTEGIFAEPASASAVACLSRAIDRGLVESDETIVVVITSAGLKDTKAVSKLARATRQVHLRADISVARMQVGETKLELLRLIASRPNYGYDLWRSVSQSRRITTASIYQHLSELERLDLVRRSGSLTTKGRERLPYELTRKGGDLLRIGKEIVGKSPRPRPGV